ncbi:cytochrome P450 [Amycolatopsis sp. cg5]|uniref:cytochrome P450 n=1 Tax=Amycolatopsis sp. cg5 TaxID=3238802 RepID=UPI0035241345
MNAQADNRDGVLELAPGRLLVWNPDAIDEIFHADQRLGHPGSRTMRSVLGHKSLLWTEGSRHLAYRRALGPALRGKRLAGYRELISEIVQSSLGALTEGRVIALADWTRAVALRVMAGITVGRDGEAVLAPFTAWMDKALGSRGRTLAYRYLRGSLPTSGEELDRLLVRSAKRSSGSLAALLTAGEPPLGPLDDTELRDQLVSLLFAGHETTASAIAWTLYWLDRNPRVRQDIVDELASTVEDGASAADVPLLHAAVLEALRVTPPVPAAGNRVCTETGEVGGRPVCAGTVLTPSIYLAHHRRERFSDPHGFEPGRFLDRRVAQEDFFPFGGGIRHCLGSELGLMEARMIVAAVLRCRELRCVNPAAGVPRLRGHAMAPSPELRMKVVACHA